jgi:ketosteroid isomerase-like protein
MTSADDVREIENLVRERADAVRLRQSEVLLSREHPDVLRFPLLPPTAARGRASTAAALSAWFTGYADGPGYTVHDIEADVVGDLAWCAFFYHVTGVLVSGDEVDMWVRSSLVYRRIDGVWQIVHSHESVPFDAGTGQALISEPPPPIA